MTYIKPEAANPSFLIQRTLDLGSTAAQQRNWLEVSNQLKLLPQSRTKLFLLEPEDWHTAFHLALKMLIEADFQHKWEITKLLPLFGDEIIEPLCNLALDETIEVEVRWFICKVLGKFPARKVILTLVELLQQTTSSELTTIAEKTLIEIGDCAVDALIDLLSQPKHRTLAVRALSYIRTSQTIAPLLEVSTADEPELRTIAIAALSSFHDARIPPVLIAALQDRASSVRREAAIALGFRADLSQELDLITQLKPLLYDLDLEVCKQTAISLGRMKQTEATTALFAVLQADTTPYGLKSDLIKALAWSENALAIGYLQQALNNASELVVREIIMVLGRITTPELKRIATKALINFWQNNRQCSSAIKQTLATSLGQLRCHNARQVLEEIVEDSDRKVKLHAFSALKKLSDASN